MVDIARQSKLCVHAQPSKIIRADSSGYDVIQWSDHLSAVHRLFPRTFHRSCVLQLRKHDLPNPVSHGIENYFEDGNDTPPPNDPIYKVDATPDAAESAYEAPSGPWIWAGAGTKEYRTVSQDEPCEMPNDPEITLRYGGGKRYMEEKGAETSKTWEVLEGTDRLERKPEGQA